VNQAVITSRPFVASFEIRPGHPLSGSRRIVSFRKEIPKYPQVGYDLTISSMNVKGTSHRRKSRSIALLGTALVVLLAYQPASSQSLWDQIAEYVRHARYFGNPPFQELARSSRISRKYF